MTTRIEYMQEEIERKIKFAREALIERMETVKDRAEYAIKLAKGGLNPNSLGELQSAGVSADVACGKLVALCEAQELIEWSFTDEE